jgi:replication fork clamp-binding protein CrfC
MPIRQSSPAVPSVIRANEDLSPQEQVEAILIKKLIESYFLIVRKNIGDTVPKSLMIFLVNKSKQFIGEKLIVSPLQSRAT